MPGGGDYRECPAGVSGIHAFFPVIVVSAMAGVTDQLLRIARHACAGEREAYEEELALLRLKHLDAAKIVAQNADKHTALVAELKNA